VSGVRVRCSVFFLFLPVIMLSYSISHCCGRLVLDDPIGVDFRITYGFLTFPLLCLVRRRAFEPLVFLRLEAPPLTELGNRRGPREGYVRQGSEPLAVNRAVRLFRVARSRGRRVDPDGRGGSMGMRRESARGCRI